MIGLRPKPSGLFLERPRLLRLLPEEPGYGVWLEAPYGYGKSVLLAQWMARLEEEGWRVVWLALSEDTPTSRDGPSSNRATGAVRPGLALALDLPEDAPWSVILGALAQEPTAVVLEDLEGSEELGPLLKHNPGLVLLASRRGLRDPEIPRLRSEGRLIHLRAEQLVFTLEEAAQLFGEAAKAREAWERTGGWSLPLHLAALQARHNRGRYATTFTGEIPDDAGLWEGMRESLGDAEWREVLFLASLPYLPLAAADERDAALARLGFVQTLERGYRLHPLAANQLLSRYLVQVQAAVRQEAGRLDPLSRGLAFERAELWPELEALLTQTAGLGDRNPRVVERWDRRLPPSRVPAALVRSYEVGVALGRLGQNRAAAERFLGVARSPQASHSQALLAYGEAADELARIDLLQARQAVLEGDALLGEADPEAAARYLNASAGVDYWSNRIQAAAERYARALRLAPPGPLRASCQYNLSLMRWWLDGDGEALLAAREALVRDPGLEIPPAKLAFYCRNAGIKAMMTGFSERAAVLLSQTLEYADADPLSALQAEAALALLEGRLGGARAVYPGSGPGYSAHTASAGIAIAAGHGLEVMPAIWARLKAWDNPNAEDRILAAWILALLDAGRPAEALVRLAEDRGSSSSFVETLRPLVLWANGRTEEALEALPPPKDPVAERETALYVQATRFRITRDERELEAFLGLTAERERPLVYFVPLRELPRTRPELARHYPIQAVLESGWKEAIALRLDEIPPLELRLLGGFGARILGKPVPLNPRPRDALILLALGLSREAVAEALWPELDTEKSRNNLHVTLNGLRKSLEPWGVPTYLLENGLSRVQADLWELEAALRAGDAAEVCRRYALLVPESGLGWLSEARESLRQRAVEVVLKARGGFSEDVLEWVLAQDPLHEEAFSRLLELLVRSGRRATARRRYAEFAGRLQRELGLEPQPGLRELLV
jgi:DNA-binding SARP family transcriptional activator/tetratricopeptide (TPR) repeat protein